jgi:hypothetical protein
LRPFYLGSRGRGGDSSRSFTGIAEQKLPYDLSGLDTAAFPRDQTTLRNRNEALTVILVKDLQAISEARFEQKIGVVG